MKQRILGYVQTIDLLLETDSPETDWEEEIRKHLIQVGFFQHERLIHLMVTLTFALLAVGTLLVELVTKFMPLLGVFFLLMILLVPYIKHYFLLENKTQYMYEQYDEMLKRVLEKKDAVKEEETETE